MEISQVKSKNSLKNVVFLLVWLGFYFYLQYGKLSPGIFQHLVAHDFLYFRLSTVFLSAVIWQEDLWASLQKIQLKKIFHYSIVLPVIFMGISSLVYYLFFDVQGITGPTNAVAYLNFLILFPLMSEIIFRFLPLEQVENKYVAGLISVIFALIFADSLSAWVDGNIWLLLGFAAFSLMQSFIYYRSKNIFYGIFGTVVCSGALLFLTNFF
ncbi:CPBP family glutamic-type intramembrane protease [Enterococcus timonensis]|uniref:CPBP family glutamic-type intramembrane protease n=1 Tax=Enterococcus timonensis TaxID=1852364 RepID=UPI0008DAC7D4|nr:CPBP family glutamic-type intramembrane protease [Enterococcus timonensis]